MQITTEDVIISPPHMYMATSGAWKESTRRPAAGGPMSRVTTKTFNED